MARNRAGVQQGCTSFGVAADETERARRDGEIAQDIRRL